MNNSGIFRSAAICTIFEALGGGGGGGGTYVPSLNFKTSRFVCGGGSHVVVDIFFLYLCFCPRCRSFNPSLCCLSPFLLSYVAVSRPCHL